MTDRNKEAKFFSAFEARLTEEQRQQWLALESPFAIQAFLDSVQYSAEDTNRTPLQVIQDHQAHCLDGGLFAAAALRKLGYPALVVDIFPDPGMDDDHVLAVYQLNGGYGCVAKSNFVGLRSRQPVYRTLRELVMSYFDSYFNVNGQITLRSYTRPVPLSRFDPYDWLLETAAIDRIEQHLLAQRRISLLSPQMAAALTPVDPITYRAGMLIVNQAGLYKPKNP